MMDDVNRRDFLKLSAAAAAALAARPIASPAQSTRASARPNILVFLTDDHGQWAQHSYGNSELKTPHLDALAAGGVRMTNAFTPTPVCSPARATFWTGRMPSQHGIHDWLDETRKGYDHPGLTGQTLLPELLQKAGYHTGLVGKWHCGVDRQPQPGFDRWFSYWKNQYPHRGEQNFSDQGVYVVEHGSQSNLLTDHALAFLNEHRSAAASRDKPFFLFVGYVDTHSPHADAPDDLVAEYADATFKDIPDEPFAKCHGTIRTGKAANARKERERQTQYYAAASNVDREVGRIVEDLKASGQFENTLIVYTSDHGLNCGHHGIWEKGNGTMPQNFLDESTRISCTFHWPAGELKVGGTCANVVTHCDTWATLLQLADAVPDAATLASIHSPGRSFLPQLRGESPVWADEYVGEYGNARMIRTKTHKLILRYPFGGVQFPNELYDLSVDPRETVNRYHDAGAAPLVGELTTKIARFFAAYSEPACDGLALTNQPVCNEDAPWIVAAKATTRPA